MIYRFFYFLERQKTVRIAILVAVFWSVGCGYTFQNSRNELFLREGIQKIYVAPIANNTFKPGVETVVYNNLVRTLAARGRVTLVQHEADSDAVLNGTVGSVTYSPFLVSPVSGLNPMDLGSTLPTATFGISTVYMANLSCSFTLSQKAVPPLKQPKPSKPPFTWSAGFSRSAPFPAANQLDVPGTTSALINDSEFDRALADLAHSMMDDVHESMLAMF